MAAISPDQVASVWPTLNTGMDKMLKYSLHLHNADSIRERCMSGDWLLFCMYQGPEPVVSIVADIRQGDGCRVFEVGFCWGSRIDEWIDEVYQSFERVARECGCGAIAFNGRPGWRKLGRQFGFEMKTMIFTKELTA